MRMHRPSPAFVLAFLALFVALSGVGYTAAKLNGKRLKNRSVTARKVKKNTLTGVEINESKLAQVPSALRAAEADKVGGKSAGCPTGTKEFMGQCFELASRPPATVFDASVDCFDEGRYLANALELRALALQGGVTLGPGNELSSSLTYEAGNQVFFVTSAGPVGGVSPTSTGNALRYRCVAPLVR